MCRESECLDIRRKIGESYWKYVEVEGDLIVYLSNLERAVQDICENNIYGSKYFHKMSKTVTQN